MTNKEIINTINRLEAMARREKNAIEANPDYCRMSIQAAYKIFANKRILKEKIAPYEDALTELTHRYQVTLDTNGFNTENLTVDKCEAFMKELNELLMIEVDVPIDKLTIEQFGDYNISQEDMEALGFMIL